MKKISSRRKVGGDVVEVRIECGSQGKAVFHLMHKLLVKINRRFRTSGGSGISYEIQLKESETSTSS